MKGSEETFLRVQAVWFLVGENPLGGEVDGVVLKDFHSVGFFGNHCGIFKFVDFSISSFYEPAFARVIQCYIAFGFSKARVLVVIHGVSSEYLAVVVDSGILVEIDLLGVHLVLSFLGVDIVGGFSFIVNGSRAEEICGVVLLVLQDFGAFYAV